MWPCYRGGIYITQEKEVSTDETTEQLANIVGEMRDRIRDKLESMEAEGVTCVPINPQILPLLPRVLAAMTFVNPGYLFYTQAK